MATELAKVYEPKSVEGEIYRRWLEAKAFHAEPDGGKVYSIVIPPPNVTAALHLGHALNNTLQDILVRWKRMAGYNTLWMPGTDHAGIATQTVVEKRILTEEGKRRTDFTREEFVARIQQWKDEYESRILGQLKAMGCSCDWDRTRFTMDQQCAKAVRAAFFRLFADGLIYRGKRLVNWDPATQTVLADDEVEHETVNGHFWYLKYPLVEPAGAGGTGVSPVRGMDVSSMRPTGVSPVEDEVQKRQGAYLPHWIKTGGIYSVTFRLADSLPAGVIEGYLRDREELLEHARRQGRELTRPEQRELSELFTTRVESHLNAGYGSCAMKNPVVADLVLNALLHFDAHRYDLLAWCVMPNHVHVVVRPREGHPLAKILQSWKSFTAKEANKLLAKTGQFWQEEYYDHLVRDEDELAQVVNYVLSNPQKADLRNWRWCGSKAHEQVQQMLAQGQDIPATQGQDAPATHGQDARATLITHVTVATTRPETMLGDTAVAINPRDPRAAALLGKHVRLPIVGRIIPIIADEHVVLPDAASEDEKARFSTGFLKVTPAHDPNDYEIRQRHNAAHADEPIDIINVLAPDGTISHKHGWSDWETIKNPDVENLIGLDRFEAREAIVEFFRQEGLLEDVRDYVHEVGHSYRSLVPIEPYLSDQWFIAVKKPIPHCQLPIDNCQWTELRDNQRYLTGTDVPANSLAGLALLPLLEGKIKFVPERYANNYRAWLENLRDWPISRQLWWGHRLPVWSVHLRIAEADYSERPFAEVEERFLSSFASEFDRLVDNAGLKGDFILRRGPASSAAHICSKSVEGDALLSSLRDAIGHINRDGSRFVAREATPAESHLAAFTDSFDQDPDVLDTWFSSGLWPISTMGWPEETPLLKTFYPTSVLCTAREIITLWVSRMVMFGQCFRSDIPFHDVYIHAMIQDGQGRKMSKSLGNGIDPLDIIESHGADAMRFTLAYMTTETQDVRMPVEEMTLPDGRKVNSSPKFDFGRNFCNKLWNASRFAMMNLSGAPAWPANATAKLPDAWILSRMTATIRDVDESLSGYRFHEAAETLYRFMWNDFCDWCLEIAKARINAGEAAPKAIVAAGLDTLLRLLHPFIPFITEAIWQHLNEVCPNRGPYSEMAEPMLIKAAWPRAESSWLNQPAEQRFAMLQQLISGIREVRNVHNVPPGLKLAVTVQAAGEDRAVIQANADLLAALASAEPLAIADSLSPSGADATVLAGNVGALVHDVVDKPAEIARLKKRQETLAKGIAAAEGKLGNEKFLAKAPPDVVKREQERLAVMREELAALEKALGKLL